METGKIPVDVNVRDEHKQWTVLHWAALGGDEAILQYLLDHHADPTLVDEDGMMAVHLAHLSGHRKTVAMLRKAMGVDENSKAGGDVLDRLLLDSVKFTLKSGQSQKMRNLLETGANPDAKTADDKEWTGLHIAAHAGHIELLRVFVSNGASADIVDAKGFTPLHFAAHRGHLQAVELLVESGADLSLMEQNTGSIAQTLAEDQGHAEVAAYLAKVQLELDELAELEKEEL